MGKLDDFVFEIENDFNVKVNDWTYSTTNCWDPMEITLTSKQFQKFIRVFGNIGEFSGAKYQIVGNQSVNIYASEGNVIKQMLSTL